MFEKEKFVIGVSRSNIKVASISGSDNTVKLIFESQWNPESMVQTVAAALDHLKIKEVYLLLHSDIVYDLEITIDPNIPFEEEKKQVSATVASTFPDELSEAEWSYQEIASSGNTKTLLVYAPVKAFFQQIINAITQSGGRIILTEPEFLAVRKNPDAFIGITMKGDR